MGLTGKILLFIAALVVLLVGGTLAFTTVQADRLARGTPLAVLVIVQSFRLPLELAMHRAFVEGLMPVQMSYSGLNFDIVTGTTALVLGLAMMVTRVLSNGVRSVVLPEAMSAEKRWKFSSPPKSFRNRMRSLPFQSYCQMSRSVSAR